MHQQTLACQQRMFTAAKEQSKPEQPLYKDRVLTLNRRTAVFLGALAIDCRASAAQLLFGYLALMSARLMNMFDWPDARITWPTAMLWATTLADPTCAVSASRLPICTAARASGWGGVSSACRSCARLGCKRGRSCAWLCSLQREREGGASTLP